MTIGTGHDPVEPDPEEPERPGKKWTLAISGLIGVFVLLSAYALISVVGGSHGGTSASSTTSPTTTHATSAPVSTPGPVTSASTAGPAASAPRSSPSPADSPAQHVLSVASVTAFGPEGTSDGDNPGITSRVNGGGAQPWYSSWYASPKFGNLQAGTGLLLDMGKAVKVSSVQLALGSPLGADVQVRIGDTAALPDLSTVATAANVGGVVQLPAIRASGRYVLVWFTTLPPNGQGEYQVNVYSATVYGSAET